MIPATLHRTWFVLAASLLVHLFASAQCTNYIIFMDDDANAADVSWNLVDQSGTTVLSGGAPYSATVCLTDGCYTLLMFDSAGDDWDGLDWEIEAEDGSWDDHATLNNSSQDLEQFELGEGDCNVGGGNNCVGGQDPFYINSDPGGSPGQMSWTLALNGVVISSGGSNTNDTLCLGSTCLVLVMNDSGNNGWQGGSITITDADGVVVYTGTLASGTSQTVAIPINGGNCSDPGGGPGGGEVPGTGPGGGCSGLPPGGDCATTGCACDPFTFQITPSGGGNVNEVPTVGSVSNPSFTAGPPWGGTAPFGCLLAGELNSTWITFTVGTSGSLQFSFGAGGQQAGFYDWAMWPLNGASTCAAISNSTLAPVRCVWNASASGGTGLASSVPIGGDPGNYGPPLNVLAGDRFVICLSNWSFVNASVTMDFFGSAGIQCGNVALPMELIDLSATVRDLSVDVEWVTGSEQNSGHFDIQRAWDGATWSTIGSIPAQGYSPSPTNYRFTDSAPGPGTNYYRLHEVDNDATFLDTYAVSAYLPVRNELIVFPQPNTGVFNLSGAHGMAPVIIDEVGRIVPFRQVASEDPDRISIDMHGSASGLYVALLPETGRTARFLIR